MANFYIPIFYLLLALCTQSSATTDQTRDDQDLANININQKYMEMDKQLLSLVGKSIKQVLPAVMEANEHLNISVNCSKSIVSVTSGMRTLKVSALSFLDASGKLSDGLLSENFNLLGDYSQCLSTTVEKKDGTIDFQGKYCLLQYSLIPPETNSQIKLGSGQEEFFSPINNGSELLRRMAGNAMKYSVARFGICVPSACTENDIGQVIQYFAENSLIKVRIISCQEKGWTNILNTRNIVIICIFCVFGMLGILGTIVEHYVNRKDERLKIGSTTNVLICFSFTRNFQKLMDMKTRSDNTLSCLHGIRVFSLFYIMLGHEYYMIMLYPLGRHLTFMSNFFGRFFSQIILNTNLCVEVFFFMSGVVHSYGRKNKERNDDNTLKRYITMIILRIWRLAPSYIFTVLANFLLVAQGPLASELERKKCEKNWWWNLLLINNFFKSEETCLLHSWYVAADMQLFLVSLVTIGLLLRARRKGIFANLVVLSSGIVIIIVWCWIQNSPPYPDLSKASKEQIDTYMQIYTSPFPHIAPYFIGIFLGYFLAVKKEVKIQKLYQVIGWTTAFASYATVIFVTTAWDRGTKYTRAEASLYFAFGRVAYTLSVGWMVLCCATGHGGIINYILSMKFWIPLSRLSYATYLISFVVQHFSSSNKRFSYDLNETNIIWAYFGDIVVSLLMALLIVLLVESPSIALQNLLLRKDTINSPEVQKKLIKNGNFRMEPVNEDTFAPNEISENEFELNQKN